MLSRSAVEESLSKEQVELAATGATQGMFSELSDIASRIHSQDSAASTSNSITITPAQVQGSRRCACAQCQRSKTAVLARLRHSRVKGFHVFQMGEAGETFCEREALNPH